MYEGLSLIRNSLVHSNQVILNYNESLIMRQISSKRLLPLITSDISKSLNLSPLHFSNTRPALLMRKGMLTR